MLARELIDRIERRGLLDPEVIEALRDQLQESRARVTPEALAKLLVDNGQLTRFQATKLIGELRSGEYDDTEAAAIVEEDLGLADGLEQPQRSPANQPKGSGPAEAILIDDEDDGEIVDAEVVDAEIVDAEVIDAEVIDAEVVDAEVVDAEVIDAMDAPQRAEGTPARPKTTTKFQQTSQWDSFKIYGYGTILVILTLAFFLLYWWYNRGNEDQFLKQADALYKEQNYEGSLATYKNYLTTFPSGKSSSLARVRVAMSNLYLERMNSGSDASRPHKLAAEILPTLEEESALEEERDNLAEFLIGIAEKLVDQADLAKESEQKRKQIGVYDDHMKLIDNPVYFPTSIRQSLASRFNELVENRARVMRDVLRDEATVKALAEIKAALENKDTTTAFATRKSLVRDYPQLYNFPEIMELVLQASKIQQELVKTKQPAPKLIDDELKSSALKSVALANRIGEKQDALNGQIYYARSQGSVFALGADDGRILWRQFVGYRDQFPPLPMGANPEDGVLLSDGERLEVQKWDGASGKPVWRAEIGEVFLQPVIHRGFVYITTESGRVISLDQKTGRARWVSQLPQPCTSMPGIDANAGIVYVAGDHSNLYMLSNTDGSCVESYYLGHEQGTIAVAPSPLLGHLFIYENPTIDNSIVRVFKVNEKGLGLTLEKNDIRMVGRIVVQPESVTRRLHILTDRGHVIILDIDTAKPNEQVSQVAEQVASYVTPVRSTMCVDKGQMWVASNRLVRLQIQINTGKVVPEWSEFDSDVFISPPRLMGNALITSRIMSGTDGIRVSANDPKTREELWRIDIGVPTTLVAKATNAPAYYAISGKAALYELNPAAVNSGTTAGPIENPGISGREFRVADPISMGEGRWVMHNKQNSGQLVVFDPTREREKLRLVAVYIPGSKLATVPARVGDGILLCLDTGRMVYANWQTGAELSSPFQAPAKPREKYKWTVPAVLNDGQEFVIVDNFKKIRRMSVQGSLNEAQSASFEREALGGAAAIGNDVLLAVRSPGGDLISVVDGMTLASKKEQPVDGKILAGPALIEGTEGLAFVILDQNRIQVIDANGSKKWEQKLPDSQVVGKPTVVDGNLLVCGANGWIANLDPQSGNVKGLADLNQPIATTPYAVGNRLLVSGAEGEVFIVEIPQGGAP